MTASWRRRSASPVSSAPDIPFRRLAPEAVIPQRAHPGDAGLDLVSVEHADIAPGARCAVGTGLAVAVPAGMAGVVVPRSGRALRDGLTVANAPGLIDSGYRGELRVILVNLGASEVVIHPGDRVAQFVVVPVAMGKAVEADRLPGTDGRGEGGFGSTGR